MVRPQKAHALDFRFCLVILKRGGDLQQQGLVQGNFLLLGVTMGSDLILVKLWVILMGDLVQKIKCGHTQGPGSLASVIVC